MEERRRSPRVKLKDHFPIIDMANGRNIGNLVDLTPHGMLLRGKHIILDKAQMDLSLRLPKTIFGRRELDVLAKCVWTKPDDDQEFILSGFEFVEVTPQDANTILGIIMDPENLD